THTTLHLEKSKFYYFYTSAGRLAPFRGLGGARWEKPYIILHLFLNLPALTPLTSLKGRTASLTSLYTQ
ncbi:hypothetical protein, partial [Thermophagus xiamenensis]|uniref:hypothetical protein n=1 Tax=Thermophagus xiamenensis TaxID=385682 RepID=UPI001ED8D4ED